MARAVSTPIGRALLRSRPLAYLPTPVRDVLAPAAAVLGHVEAVMGFNQVRCADAERTCWQAADAPSYTQSGVVRMAYRGTVAIGPAQGEIDLSARVTKVGYLIKNGVDYETIYDGRCPGEQCLSDYAEGTFAAQIDLDLTV